MTLGAFSCHLNHKSHNEVEEKGKDTLRYA